MPTRLETRALVLGATVIGLVLALIALLSVELNRSYHREVDYAASVTRSIARTLEQQLLASMDRIDLLAREAAYQYRAFRTGSGPAAGEMNAILARHLERVPGLLSLRLINEKGEYVFDASGTVSPASIADRRYFRVQAEQPDTGLFPEGPLFSRVVSQWTLTFSRGVRDAEGRFLGIVQSSIQTAALASAFNKASLGSSDAITLLNGEGALVARFPELSDLIGKSSVSDELRRLIAARVEEQTYSGISGADGQMRLYTLRRVGPHPFFVLVGMSYDKILGEWRRTASVYGVLAAVLLVGAIVLAVRIFIRYSATVRQAEEQRRLTSEVFANALEGIIVTDQNSRILSANQAMCEITGYGLDELIGATPARYRSARHDAAFFGEFWQVLHSQGRWQGEVWNRRKSGTMFPAWLSVSMIPDGSGVRYIGVYTDISEQKAAEQRLQFTNAELLRLTEITAHHLQEPSRRLITFAQRLKTALAGRELPEAAAIALTFIEQQAARLRALIRDIQLYLIADQPAGPVTTLQLAEVIDEARATRAAALSAAEAEVQVVADGATVRLDRRRMTDILGNLLDNAIRYRWPGKALRIGIYASTAGGKVQIRVSDNGPGIEPEYRELVFRVFERLHPVPGDDSTGIGLSIVRRVVEHEGGRTWIEETPGGGNTVVLELIEGSSA